MSGFPILALVDWGSLSPRMRRRRSGGSWSYQGVQRRMASIVTNSGKGSTELVMASSIVWSCSECLDTKTVQRCRSLLIDSLRSGVCIPRRRAVLSARV